MTQRLSLEQIDGQTVVAKRAVDGEQRRQLAHEARQLGSLQHPGVVGLVSYTEGDSHDTLMTTCAGTVTLADYSPADLGAVAGVMAGAATVLSDLHAAGMAHGAVQADHVIIGESRHAILCSFGQSGPASSEAVERDVAGLIEMIGALTLRARLTAGAGTRRQDRQLRTIVSTDPARPTTASAVAARLAEVPGASHPIISRMPDAVTDPLGAGWATPLSDELESPLEGTRTWPDRVPLAVEVTRSRGPVPVGVVFVAVIALLALWTGMTRDGRDPLDAQQTTTPVPQGASLPAPRSLPLAQCPDRVGVRLQLDVDGDGCVDEVAVEGNLVRVGEKWYSAGSAGDVVVVGDWNCDRVATVALLRPRSGEIFVFESWANTVGEPVNVRPVAYAEGATALQVRHTSGCDSLYAVDELGSAVAAPVVLE